MARPIAVLPALRRHDGAGLPGRSHLSARQGAGGVGSGEPVKSIWTGLKIKRGEQRDVTTFRCRRCGYLESYA